MRTFVFLLLMLFTLVSVIVAPDPTSTSFRPQKEDAEPRQTFAPSAAHFAKPQMLQPQMLHPQMLHPSGVSDGQRRALAHVQDLAKNEERLQKLTPAQIAEERKSHQDKKTTARNAVRLAYHPTGDANMRWHWGRMAKAHGDYLEALDKHGGKGNADQGTAEVHSPK